MSRLMTILFLIIQYGLGGFFLLIGFGTSVSSVHNWIYLPIGLGMLGISVLLLPPTRGLIEARLKRPLKSSELAVLLPTLLFGPFFFMSFFGTAKTETLAKAGDAVTSSPVPASPVAPPSSARPVDDGAARFLAEKPQILERANKLFRQRKHAEAMALIHQYDQWEDKDLKALETRVEVAEQARRDIELANQRRLEAERQERERLSWHYQAEKDDMTGKPISYAKLLSVNSFEFGFPYEGSQNATLTIRKHPRWGTDLILEIEKGQFACMGSDCAVSVRFDNGAIIAVDTNDAGSHDPTVKFLRDPEGLIHQIQLSRRLIIEANFYNEGVRTFEFRTEGYVEQ